MRIVERALKAGAIPCRPRPIPRAKFGVNRSTVREAVRELETHGIHRTHPRREAPARDAARAGSRGELGVSRALALHDVTDLELWEAMMAIELGGGAYAAARRTPAQLPASGAHGQAPARGRPGARPPR